MFALTDLRIFPGGHGCLSGVGTRLGGVLAGRIIGRWGRDARGVQGEQGMQESQLRLLTDSAAGALASGDVALRQWATGGADAAAKKFTSTGIEGLRKP